MFFDVMQCGSNEHALGKWSVMQHFVEVLSVQELEVLREVICFHEGERSVMQLVALSEGVHHGESALVQPTSSHWAQHGHRAVRLCLLSLALL